MDKAQIQANRKSPAEKGISFEHCSIVACGTLSMELNLLKKSGFLNARRIEYTKPGRHEVPRELEQQLVDRIGKAKRYTEAVIVVYGGKFCFIDMNDPSRTIDQVIAEQGGLIARTDATHCVDMLAGVEQRERIRDGEKVFWLTPGWVIHRDLVFQDWDKGKANETFPQHTGGAVVLDAVGFWDDYSARHPEKLLDFSDWMGIPIRPRNVSLSRLKGLLSESLLKLYESGGIEVSSTMAGHR
jgi:hypothetical protein